MAIKPETSVESLVKYADIVDTLLIMTVEPGFGGQKFMHDMMPKVCGCAVDVFDVCNVYETRQMPFNNVYCPILGLGWTRVESGTFLRVWKLVWLETRPDVCGDTVEFISEYKSCI